jgi:hypothetical protein
MRSEVRHTSAAPLHGASAAGAVNARTLLALAAVFGLFLVIFAVWETQAYRARGEFRRVVQRGAVEALPPDLRDKTWSREELSGARVVKVARGYGKERAIGRLIHTRGDYTIPSATYAYQATLTDSATGIRHVFGRLRGKPGAWRHVGIHPDSARLHIQRRQDQLDTFLQERRAP